MDRRREIRPCIRAGIVRPRLRAVSIGRESAEEDHPIGLSIVRHALSRANRRVARRGEVGPRVVSRIEGPRLVGEGSQDAIEPAEHDRPTRGAIVRGPLGPARVRVNDRGQVRPGVRSEVVGPRLVAPVGGSVVATEEDHAVRGGVVDRCKVHPRGWGSPGTHVRPFGSGKGVHGRRRRGCRRQGRGGNLAREHDE